MRLIFNAVGWQLSVMLCHPKTYPEIRLPSEEEIKAMLKQAYQRFRDAIKKQKEQAGRGT